MSWIIVYKGSLTAVCELFCPESVNALNTEKYEALEAGEYLKLLNLHLNNGLTYKDKIELGIKTR